MTNNEKNINDKGFQFIINAQYLKDLSFENPKAPKSLKNFNVKPEIKVDIDIKTRPLKEEGEDIFEVDLLIKGTTSIAGDTTFLVESTYSGIFTLKNVPDNVLDKILLIECPKFLFPFLRSIIASCTRDGGFPPLMITPIDFVNLYEKNKKN